MDFYHLYPFEWSVFMPRPFRKQSEVKRESDFQRISWVSEYLVWHKMFPEYYFENSDPAANCLALTHPSLSELVLPGTLPVPSKCSGIGRAVAREHAFAVRKQKKITTNPKPNASPKISSGTLNTIVPNLLMGNVCFSSQEWLRHCTEISVV